jgi:acetyl esterase/lipase
MSRWTLAFFAFIVPLVLWVTAAEGTEPRTAIVAIHGGGWYGGTPQKMDRVCAAVAPALGMDCFQPSYTLSGVAPFGAAASDVRAFVDGLRAQGYDRVIGIGASAGGQLAAWLASKGHVDAAVTLSAPTNLVVLDDWHRDQCKCWVIDQYAPTDYKKTQASPALASVNVPILIIHAANETLIPRRQAGRLAEVSTEATLHILPDDDRHAMSYFDDVAPEITAWIAGLA